MTELSPQKTVRAALVYGTDELRVKQRAAAFAEFMKTTGDWSTEIIDAWQDNVESGLMSILATIQALKTPPFLGSEQFIWVKNATFFSETDTIKISSNAEIKAALNKLIQIIKKGLPEGVRLLISAPGARVERAKKDEHVPALQELEESGIFVVEKIHLPSASFFGSVAPPVEEITAAFKQAGLRIHPEALQQLVELSSNDPRQIRSEVEKLITYCWGLQEVLPRHVSAVVTPTAEESFWTWCDAVVEKRTSDALELLRQLRFQGENPLALLINLANHARLLVKIRLLSDRRLLSAGGVATGEGTLLLKPPGGEKSPPSQGRVKRILQQSRRCTLQQWRIFFHKIYDAYVDYFETGQDCFTMLYDLVLRLHISESGAGLKKKL